MYCESCGNTLNPNDKFCEKCGAGVTIAPIYVESTHVDAPRLQSSNIKFTKRSLACIILADLCLFLFILNILKFVMSEFGHSRIHWVLNIWELISVLLGGALSVYACVYTSRSYNKAHKHKFLVIWFSSGLFGIYALIRNIHILFTYYPDNYYISIEFVSFCVIFPAIKLLLNFIITVLFLRKKYNTVLFYSSVVLGLAVAIWSFIGTLPDFIEIYGLGTFYSDWEGFILWLAGQILSVLGAVLLILIFNHNRKHDIYEEYKPQF